MNPPDPLAESQRYNAALRHATVSVAIQHLIRKSRSFRVSEFVEQVARIDSYPDVSIAHLLAAARGAGLPLRGLAYGVHELDQLPVPVLGCLKQGSEPGSRVDVIQIERVGRSHVTLSSDRFATIRVPRPDFERRWAGIALIAEADPTDPGESGGELEAFRKRVCPTPDMLTRDECSALIAYCEQAGFSRSRVGQRAGGSNGGLVALSFRSSSSVVLLDRDHPVLARLYRQCATREGVDPRQIEPAQGVRYKRGQRFKAHYDGGVNLPRLTTYLVYLNDDFTGGETYFPLLDLAVAPVAGSCLRFPSCEPDGRIVWPSEHGGLPVRGGIKYALNIWVRCPGVPGDDF